MGKAAVPPPVTQVMEAAGGWLTAALNRVEGRIEAAVDGYGGTAAEQAMATLGSGGKRIRPLLVLLCAGPEAGDDAVRAAVAVELVHTATLVHDDVLDNAPLRRGAPTVFSVAGRRGAIATGDLLFSRAFAELSAGGRRETVSELSQASLALAEGELMQRADAWNPAVTEDRYLRRCELKTARLFEAACYLGAAADPGADEGRVRGLAQFGRGLGVAFQMLDDVLDVEGPPERTGKARGTDLLDGTVTLPLIKAMQQDPKIAEVDLRGLDERSASELCDRIAGCGALAVVRHEALGFVEQARASLAALELPQQRSDLLATVAQGVVDRYS